MGLNLKKFKNLLISQQRIALDSSCFIYHIEEKQKYLELTKIIFTELLATGKIRAVASTLIITEILTKPYSLDNHDLALVYKDLITNFPNLALLAPNEQICDYAARLRVNYGFKTPDAIHLATAIESGAKAIIANDRRWRRVGEIKTVLLEEFV